MATGKKTGGRKKGTPNRTTLRREREIAKSGLTPLEYMLQVMRNPRVDGSRRDDMAKAAAPYVHPKLANHQLTGKGGGPIEILDLSKATDEQLDALASLIGPIASGPGDDDEGDTSGTGEA